MKRELFLALCALVFIFTPAGPLQALLALTVLALSLWAIIDLGVDCVMNFWNRWISS